MSGVWNKVYKSDNTFFRGEASNFALLCFNHMKANSIKKVLDLGAGHGRDSIFFASNGIEVEALDYSAFAVELLNKTTKEKRLPLKPHLFDVKHQLTYPDGYFQKINDSLDSVKKYRPVSKERLKIENKPLYLRLKTEGILLGDGSLD
jgi:methylase of polypeptide subunit release factors